MTSKCGGAQCRRSDFAPFRIVRAPCASFLESLTLALPGLFDQRVLPFSLRCECLCVTTTKLDPRLFAEANKKTLMKDERVERKIK